MNLSQLIKDRRSIAVYQDKEVSTSLIKELLDVAIWVPNHKLTEPWRFVMVKGESKKKLAEINRLIAMEKSNTDSLEDRELIGENAYQKIMNVPFILFVLNALHPQEKLREEDYASTSCVIQNFSLLAWEKDLSVFWKTGKLAFCQETAQLIGLDKNERVVGLLQIGYPDKKIQPVERSQAKEKITELE
ncbi:nitroreductase [Gracilibacillus sp. YIM 98692]|uniref:nitroreductase family protein n=1 Tax=Gracilibacillus sp. YIM 98692 TaxID=2663532 RepID=UPI0013D55C22|nr:nitroreductase [Gracilibacillus sp. YIM 98692]